MRKLLLSVLLASLALGAGCSGRSTRDIEKLLADLMSPSPSARASAERSLTEHGRAVIKPLSNLVTLKDIEQTVQEYHIRKDPKELRIPAARALGVIAARASLARSEAETAAKPLLDVLKSDGTPLRIEAVRALGKFTQLSGPANDLILLLREDNQELIDAVTESLAANALQSVYRLVLPEEPPATAAEKDWGRLLERIRSTDDDIRLDTVRELAASRDPRAAPVLLERLASDKSRDVRYAALTFCVPAAEADKPEGFAAKLYAQLPTSFENDDDSRVALLAAQLLRERKPDLVGKFLARVDAARATCETSLLADATNTGYDAATRADAIDALALLPGQRRDGVLAGFLDPASDARARVRRAAAGVLATSDSETAIGALRKAMNDSDSIVKLVAAQALGRRGDLEAVKYLVALLSDKEAKIRTPAADALGTLGARALPVLIEYLTASLERFKELARWEVPLAQLQSKESLTSQEEAEARRLQAAIAEFRRKEGARDEKYTAWGIVSGIGRIAGQIGPQAAGALDAIVEAAQCHDVDVRRIAVDALANFAGEKAIAALVKALSDPDESVQWYAARGLEEHGPAAISALVTALGDESVAATAAASLGRIGDAETLRPLLAQVGSATGETKAAIVWSIGELLNRHPDSPHAAAARKALEAASQSTDAPDAAHLARYALTKTHAKPVPEE